MQILEECLPIHREQLLKLFKHINYFDGEMQINLEKNEVYFGSEPVLRTTFSIDWSNIDKIMSVFSRFGKFIKVITITSSEPTDATLAQLIPHFPNLESLDIANCSRANIGTLRAIAHYCTNLQKLRLYGYYWTADVVNFFVTMKSLTKIRLCQAGCALNEKQLCQYFSSFPKLENIWLDRCDFDTAPAINYALLSLLPNWGSGNEDTVYFDPKKFPTIASLQSNLPPPLGIGKQILCLSNLSLSPDLISVVAKSCPRLQYLRGSQRGSYENMEDATPALTLLFKNCPDLETLYVERLFCGNPGLSEMTALILGHDKLKNIEFYKCFLERRAPFLNVWKSTKLRVSANGTSYRSWNVPAYPTKSSKPNRLNYQYYQYPDWTLNLSGLEAEAKIEDEEIAKCDRVEQVETEEDEEEWQPGFDEEYEMDSDDDDDGY